VSGTRSCPTSSAGHIWAAVKGVQLLCCGKASFAAIENPVAFPPSAVDGVGLCLAADTTESTTRTGAARGAGSLHGMIEMLRELAVHGHTPVQLRVDPRAELVGRHNVGGTVARCTRAPGIPLEAWSRGTHLTLVVPTSQAMRMLLACELGRVHGTAAPDHDT